MRGSDIILLVLAIFFPPAAVALMTGLSPDLLINIVLTFFGWIFGLIQAFWLLYKKMEAEEKWVGRGVYSPYGSRGPKYSTRDYLVRGKNESGKIWDGKWKGGKL